MLVTCREHEKAIPESEACGMCETCRARIRKRRQRAARRDAPSPRPPPEPATVPDPAPEAAPDSTVPPAADATEPKPVAAPPPDPGPTGGAYWSTAHTKAGFAPAEGELGQVVDFELEEAPVDPDAPDSEIEAIKARAANLDGFPLMIALMGAGKFEANRQLCAELGEPWPYLSNAPEHRPYVAAANEFMVNAWKYTVAMLAPKRTFKWAPPIAALGGTAGSEVMAQMAKKKHAKPADEPAPDYENAIDVEPGEERATEEPRAEAAARKFGGDFAAAAGTEPT